jgi:hypothetical protein
MHEFLISLVVVSMVTAPALVAMLPAGKGKDSEDAAK